MFLGSLTHYHLCFSQISQFNGIDLYKNFKSVWGQLVKVKITNTFKQQTWSSFQPPVKTVRPHSQVSAQMFHSEIHWNLQNGVNLPTPSPNPSNAPSPPFSSLCSPGLLCRNLYKVGNRSFKDDFSSYSESTCMYTVHQALYQGLH